MTPAAAKPVNKTTSPLAMTGVTPANPIYPGVNTADPSSQYYGMPSAPNFVVGYDPSTMSMTDYLAGHYDHSGLDAFRAQALRKGPSSWANIAQQNNLLQEQQAREHGAAQANSSTAQAMDQMAARGGSSAGARERAAIEGSKNYLSMSQDVTRQGNLNSMQIGMNDEQNRIQQLSQLPGMDQSQAQMWENAKNTDVQNTLQQTNQVNAYNQNLYNQQVSAWAANQQANATLNSGKK